MISSKVEESSEKQLEFSGRIDATQLLRMPTYALLGATGSAGSSILRCLFDEPPKDLGVSVLVRSKSKLLRRFPQLDKPEKLAIRTRIVEGDSSDVAALRSCLEDASIIFMCVGQNGSPPGTTLYSDTAAAVIDALRAIQSQHRQAGIVYHVPTIIQLRSASLNSALASQVPRVVHRMVMFCLHHGYADIRLACNAYLAAAAEDDKLLHFTFVDPPTIHDPDGTERTGYKLISTEKQEVALSYADLGAAMCEVAERADEFRDQTVGVTATGKVKASWSVLAGYLARGAGSRIGLRFHRLPSSVRLLATTALFSSALMSLCWIPFDWAAYLEERDGRQDSSAPDVLDPMTFLR